MAISRRKKALAAHLECSPSDITGEGSLLSACGGDYHVLTDREATKEATLYIQESLWAFNTDYIARMVGCIFSGRERNSFIQALKAVQETMCEDANPLIRHLVATTCGLRRFADDAIRADGRGHFLSPYDGEENEVTVDGVDYYIYRNN